MSSSSDSTGPTRVAAAPSPKIVRVPGPDRARWLLVRQDLLREVIGDRPDRRPGSRHLSVLMIFAPRRGPLGDPGPVGVEVRGRGATPPGLDPFTGPPRAE